MKKNICLLGMIAIQLMLQVNLEAGTVAYWRFEDGIDFTNVAHTEAEGVYGADVADVSGNGNDLSVWMTGGGGGYGYRANVATEKISYTGQENTLSVKNTGGGPAMWCATPAMQTMTPAAFTVEVTTKLENGGWKTIVGRDSRGTYTEGESPNGDLAALYLQVTPNNGYAIKFCDVSGYWHDATSAGGLHYGYDFGSDPDGNLAPWTSLAAVSDGSTLSLYMLQHGRDASYILIAQAEISDSGSPDTALTAGAGGGGDWDAGNWTVGRGLYGGGHGDRAYGYVDEVRISDSALNPSEFLYGPTPYYPEVAQVADTTNGDVDVVLSWQAASDPNVATTGNAVFEKIVDQYVFARDASSTDPAFYYVGAAGDPGTTDPASSLAANVDFDVYYEWVVFESFESLALTPSVSTLDDVASGITGSVWSFQALYSIPVITAQPTDLLMGAGEGPDTLSIEVESLSDNISYSWYKTDVLSNGNANGTDTLVYSVTGTDSRTNSLVIDSLDSTDEGIYYCVVTNNSGKDIVSDVAMLEVERVVAYYEFEENILDSENDNDGWLSLDPNQTIAYSAGKVGMGASLNGVDASVSVPRSLTNSMTIEFWVKTTEVGNIGGGWFDGIGLIDAEVAGFNRADFGVSLRGGKVTFGVSSLAGPYTNLDSASAVNDGSWHYCAVTRNAATGEIKVYIDGVYEGAANAPLGREVTPTSIRIGAIGVDGIDQNGDAIDTGTVRNLLGEIDEVKFYNYALDELAIADNYVAVQGGSVCVASMRPESKYDLNGDCKVDLNDFADFASGWMSCGYYPACD